MELTINDDIWIQQWPACIIFKLFSTDWRFFNLLLSRLNMSYAPWELSMYSLKYCSLGCFEEESLLQNPPYFIKEDATVQIISSMCEGTHSISSHQQSAASCTPQARCLQSKYSVSSQITVEACSSRPSYLSTSKHQGSGFAVLGFSRSQLLRLRNDNFVSYRKNQWKKGFATNRPVWAVGQYTHWRTRFSSFPFPKL